jgi:hypothetical protein
MYLEKPSKSEMNSFTLNGAINSIEVVEKIYNHFTILIILTQICVLCATLININKAFFSKKIFHARNQFFLKKNSN